MSKQQPEQWRSEVTGSTSKIEQQALRSSSQKSLVDLTMPDQIRKRQDQLQKERRSSSPTFKDRSSSPTFKDRSSSPTFKNRARKAGVWQPLPEPEQTSSKRQRWRQFRHTETSRKGDLYQKLVGEDPIKKPHRTLRAQELAQRRGTATDFLNALWNKVTDNAWIRGQNKQTLLENQQLIVQDSTTLEKVLASDAGFERRYRAEKFLWANLNELITMTQQVKNDLESNKILLEPPTIMQPVKSSQEQSDEIEILSGSSISRTSDTGDDSLPLELRQAAAKGKEKRTLFLQEAATYAENDRDTTTEFKKFFVYKVEQDETDKNLFVVTANTRDGSSRFNSKVNVQTGEFIGCNLNKDKNLDYPFSEVMFNLRILGLKAGGKKLSNFGLPPWTDIEVTNRDVCNLIPYLFAKKGGSDEYETGEKTYLRGSPQFDAMLQTSLGQSKGFSESQHQEAYKGNRYASVTLKLEKVEEPEARTFGAPSPLPGYSLTVEWKPGD